jgi:hypothetical protein
VLHWTVCCGRAISPVSKRELKVTKRVDGALEQVAELEHAASRLDQLPVGLEERHRAWSDAGSAAMRAIGRDLALARVHADLRPEGHGAQSVPPRDEVALDLDVPQRLREGSLVRDEQRLEDLLILVRKGAPQQPFGRPLAHARRSVEVVEQPSALGQRQQEERVIAQLDREARLDVLLAEVRVARARWAPPGASSPKPMAPRSAFRLGKTQWKR